jgi:hypothetical protein
MSVERVEQEKPPISQMRAKESRSYTRVMDHGTEAAWIQENFSIHMRFRHPYNNNYRRDFHSDLFFRQ